MEHIGFAFLLTFLAGLATGIGSCIAFFAPRGQTKFLALTLSFSAGVMIFVSFSELLPTAENLFRSQQIPYADFFSLTAFFIGIALTAGIDVLIPNTDNPHEFQKNKSEMQALKKERNQPYRLLRIGFFTAGALALHNFPEGIATFISATQAKELAYPIAFAVALHNIPEGIAVSVPIYYATGCRKKAFIYSFLSGLAEPLGAVIGYLFLRPFISDGLMGFVFAAIAGIMVYISLDELLPAARRYGKHHQTMWGLFMGMYVMGLSLILF